MIDVDMHPQPSNLANKKKEKKKREKEESVPPPSKYLSLINALPICPPARPIHPYVQLVPFPTLTRQPTSPQEREEEEEEGKKKETQSSLVDEHKPPLDLLPNGRLGLAFEPQTHVLAPLRVEVLCAPGRRDFGFVEGCGILTRLAISARL